MGPEGGLRGPRPQDSGFRAAGAADAGSPASRGYGADAGAPCALPAYPDGLAFTDAEEREMKGLLDAYLEGVGYAESREAKTEKFGILDKIETLLSNWVFETYGASNPASVQGYKPSENPALLPSEQRLVVLLPYGSFYLGVNARDGDIDCAVLLPYYADVAGFPSLAGKYLKARLPSLSHYTTVQTQNLSLLTVCVSGVYVDIQPSALNLRRVSRSLNLLGNAFLQNMSDKAIRVVNGVRTNMMIRRAVGAGLEAFQTSLRALKHFCSRRGISGNKFGYLGGINLSLLLCNIFVKCRVPASKLHPMRLLYAFFTTYESFDWKSNYVLPTPSGEVPDPADLDLVHKREQWQPSRLGEMTIVTLAPPVMNSAEKVYPSTKQTILREFSYGREVVARLLKGFRIGFNRREVARPLLRACLFETAFESSIPQFFHSPLYKNNFLVIQLFIARDQLGAGGDAPALESEQFSAEKVLSFVEARIVSLCLGIHHSTRNQILNQAKVESVCPLPRWFTEAEIYGSRGRDAPEEHAGCVVRSFFVGVEVSAGDTEEASAYITELIDRFTDGCVHEASSTLSAFTELEKRFLSSVNVGPMTRKELPRRLRVSKWK